MSHWIIAPIVLPALLAALMLLGLRGNLARQRMASLAGLLALNAIAVALLASVSAAGPEVYFLGDWPAPFGIVLVLDRLSALMVALLAALALPVTAYAVGSGWDAKGAHFHPLLHFLLMGVAGAFLTGDAFNLFVFFEVLLIASYGLMVHGGGGSPHPRRDAVRRLQPRRLGALPHRARPALQRHRHAQHGGPRASNCPTCRPAMPPFCASPP